jgi:hypothetical protein
MENQWTRPELPLQVDLRKEMFTAACARRLTGCDTEDREDGKEELLGEHGGRYYAVEKTSRCQLSIA